MAELVDDTEKQCQLLMTEEPKIEYAVKNVITILLATSMSNALGSGVELGRGEKLTPAVVIGCGRLLVRALNSFELMDPLDWGVAFPQGDDQTGLARISDLSQYRVAFTLWKKARSMGGKVCKLFGKSFLLWTKILNAVFTDILVSCSGVDSSIPSDTIEEFLRLFSNSLGSNQNFPTLDEALAPTSIPPNRWCNYEELAWSPQFSQQLLQRQQTRWTEIESREVWAVDQSGSSAALTDSLPSKPEFEQYDQEEGPQGSNSAVHATEPDSST